jgi:hypothetical protein
MNTAAPDPQIQQLVLLIQRYLDHQQIKLEKEQLEAVLNYAIGPVTPPTPDPADESIWANLQSTDPKLFMAAASGAYATCSADIDAMSQQLLHSQQLLPELSYVLVEHALLSRQLATYVERANLAIQNDLPGDVTTILIRSTLRNLFIAMGSCNNLLGVTNDERGYDINWEEALNMQAPAPKIYTGS